MSLDPTVAAALIGVGGAAGVAVIGFLTTMRTTRQTIASGAQTTRDALVSAEANVQATVMGEREHRLWERRTDIYIELIAFVAHRQQKRANDLKRMFFDQDSEDKIKERIDSYAPDEGWFALEAKTRAYASDKVLTALQAANTAHGEIMMAAARRGTAPPGEASVKAFNAVEDALKTGLDADEALIAIIREEISVTRP